MFALAPFKFFSDSWIILLSFVPSQSTSADSLSAIDELLAAKVIVELLLVFELPLVISLAVSNGVVNVP